MPKQTRRQALVASTLKSLRELDSAMRHDRLSHPVSYHAAFILDLCCIRAVLDGIEGRATMDYKNSMRAKQVDCDEVG